MGDSVHEVTHAFVARGDLAHLALFLWASGASGLLAWALRELGAANRRFNDMVREVVRAARSLEARGPEARTSAEPRERGVPGRLN